jgi:hypothetical protein
MTKNFKLQTSNFKEEINLKFQTFASLIFEFYMNFELWYLKFTFSEVTNG